MKYIGYKEYGNNLTNTLLFNKLRNTIPKAEGKILRTSDEYKKLIKCLVNFNTLYCLADNEQIDEKTNSGVPVLINRQNLGMCVYIFTLFNYCKRLKEDGENHFSYVRLSKVTEHAGIYNSTFQIARLLGVQYIIVNPGKEEIIIPITDLINIGELGNEVSMIQSESDVKNLLSGDALKPAFNKVICKQLFAEDIMYRFNTTWRMDYEIILDIVNNAISHCFKWCSLGKRPIAGSDIQWLIDDVPENFNIYHSKLKEETGCVVIYGYNTIMDAVMQLDFYNQLQIVDLTIINTNPDIFKYSNYEFDERVYENFMNSIELLGYMAESRRCGMSLYKNYIQSQQGICELTKQNAKSISKGIFEMHNFVPDLDKRDDGEPLSNKDVSQTNTLKETKAIKEYFVRNGLSDEKAKEKISFFEKHKEILKELVHYINHGSFIKNEINVLGYTASMLAEKPYNFTRFMPFQVLATLSEEGKEGNMFKYLKSSEMLWERNLSFDSVLIEKMMKNFKLTQKLAKDSLMNLSKYDDIFEEFTSYIKNGGELPEKNCISVEGYTAKSLYENYPLSILGAYNYLVYLRKNPKEALADLKAGLPRK